MTMMKKGYKETDKSSLSIEEMNRISGGCGSPNASHHFLIEDMQRKIFEGMKKGEEQIADVRMRAAEDALRAAMRLDKQEMDIKAAMKARRVALGLN